MSNVRNITAAVYQLANTDPTNPVTLQAVDNLVSSVSSYELQDVSLGFLKDQVGKLQVAASTPARNYTKILSIASGLNRAIEVASQSNDRALNARIATVIQKVAGIFAEVDTADDLAGKSLEQIESAVHSLYSGGKMNDPKTYNFMARGKGHHGK